MKRHVLFLAAFSLLFTVSVHGQMYMTFYSNLSVHSNGADSHSYAVVPYGWIASSTLLLSENGSPVRYTSGQSQSSSQPVSLSVSYFGYPPPFTVYDQIAEAYGDLPDYGAFWDSQYRYGQTPPPSVSIGGDGDEWDGQTGHTFSLSVLGGTPTQYAWQYSNPPDSGNNPNVAFGGWGATVTTDAHWFASPDGVCSGATPSPYTIHGLASIAEVWYQASTPYRIHIPNPSGETYSPKVYGYADMMNPTGGSGLYTVGQSHYYRTQPTVAIKALPGSQFLGKVTAHENVHVQQFTSGLFSAYWDPIAAYNLVRNFTYTTHAALSARLSAAIDAYHAGQDALVEAQMPGAEAQAYVVSDPIAPMYFYQAACGRH